MQDFADVSSFENDFGSTKEGRLLKKLDHALQGDFGEEYDKRVLEFFKKHETDLKDNITKQPLYGLAMLRVASVIGDQKLYDQMVSHCIANYLPWQKFDDGSIVHQREQSKHWVTNALRRKFSQCCIRLSDKIKLLECLIIDGQTPYQYKDLEDIGLNTPARELATQSMKHAFASFPNDPFIGTSLVVLIEDEKLRKHVAFKMLERFPDHMKLIAINDDLSVGQVRNKRTVANRYG